MDDGASYWHPGGSVLLFRAQPADGPLSFICGAKRGFIALMKAESDFVAFSVSERTQSPAEWDYFSDQFITRERIFCSRRRKPITTTAMRFILVILLSNFNKKSNLFDFSTSLALCLFIFGCIRFWSEFHCSISIGNNFCLASNGIDISTKAWHSLISHIFFSRILFQLWIIYVNYLSRPK